MQHNLEGAKPIFSGRQVASTQTLHRVTASLDTPIQLQLQQVLTLTAPGACSC